MKPLKIDDVNKYVEENIGTFHVKRLKSLENLKLSTILKRKNPYLFKAKNIDTAADFVRVILDAHLSSQEETIFGEFLEGLAIFINNRIYDGKKSTAEGIDLEFEKDGIKYLISIKSGPNWGNSSQIKKMRDNFIKAKRIVSSNTPHDQKIVFVNGCCYGRDNKHEKGDYEKLCGQKFWEFISGNVNLYTDIIEPLGHKAKEKNKEFMEAYSKLNNRFAKEFLNEYCVNDTIDWEKIVKFNSSASVPRKNVQKSK